MNKKFISVIMAAILAVSATALYADAAEVEEEAAGAEATVNVSTEDGKNTFFFDSGNWNSQSINFYIWDGKTGEKATKTEGWITGDTWASKKKLGGTPVEGKDGVFESYEVDFSGREDHLIYVIFQDPDKGQTFDAYLNASAFGHTARRNGVIYENAMDSNQTAEGIEFDGGEGLGVAKVITSTGKIQGDIIHPNTDRADVVAKYVLNYLGKNDSNGNPLVTEDSVAEAISTFGTTADDVWAKYTSYNGNEEYADKYNEDEAKKFIKPSSANDTDTSSDSDSDTSSNSSSKSSTTSSSTTKASTTTATASTGTTTAASGSADAASTGDTRGVVAFAAVLVAAAGTIVATRKKIED